MKHAPQSVAEAFADASPEDESGDVPVLEPIDGDTSVQRSSGGYVGEVWYCPTYDCKAYFSSRSRETHYYRKGEAYPIDVSILSELESDYDNVEKVFVGVREDKDVLEFDLDQYTDGEFIHHDGWSPQNYAAVSEALHIWEDEFDDFRATN